MIFANTEFYYTTSKFISNNTILIVGEEAKHISKVMRHKMNDSIYVTDGEGSIYESTIKNITEKEIITEIKNIFVTKNKLSNIIFWIPILKSQDRFEFAVEKCVELGITNFKIFSAQKSHKRGIKIERWERILLSAMKQSLRAYIPKIEYIELSELKIGDDLNLIFDQQSDIKFSNFVKSEKFSTNPSLKNVNLFFGPEAGMTEIDKNKITNSYSLRLTENRLRAETAIIASASIISTNIAN